MLRNTKDVVKVIFIVNTVLISVECVRKYDVHSESIKLYGEDLALVLKRFRRTPEYLNILQTKVTEIKESYSDMILQITYSCGELLLKEKVNKTLQEHHDDDKKSYRKSLNNILRQDEATTEVTTTLSPIQQLDHHDPFVSPFSVAEKNAFKDDGFEIAGEAIHKLIAAMGPPEDESGVKSTRMPSGVVTTTTEHASVHEVTPSPTHHTQPQEHTSVRFRANSNKKTTSTNTVQKSSQKNVNVTF